MPHRIPTSLISLVCHSAILVLLFLGTAPLVAQEVKTLDDVLSVWRKREEVTRSLKFNVASDFLFGVGPPNPTPEKERRVLIIDGARIRHQRTVSVWNDTIKASVPEVMTAVFDGSKKKRLFHRDRMDALIYSRGWINNATKHSGSHNLYLSPIRKHYRPFALGIVKIDGLRLVSTDEMVDGIPCVLIEESLSELARVAKYWVAPGQEMSIVRYTRHFKGEDEVNLETSFKRDPVHGWMPHRWSAARFNAGKRVIDSATMVVTTSDINSEVSADLFDITFPPGTLVYDGIAKRNLLVQPDGTHREVLPSELKKGN